MSSVTMGIRKDTLAIKTMVYVFLIAGAAIMALPYIWMLITSIKPIEEIQAFPPSFIVKNPTLEPYRDLFRMVPMGRYLFNSFFVAGSITLFNVFATSLAGYAFAKHTFWGRDKLFFLFIGSLIIPWQVNIIPGFIIVKNLGWLNSYKGLIIPSMAWCAFGIFLNRQFIYSIPDDLIDAARIDGCSEFMIYWHVILPLIKPVLATLAIFTFLQQWNNFVWPLVIIHTSNMRTLPLGLAVLTGQFGANFGMIMAGAVVATVPMLTVYLIFQKYIIKGIPMTGLKGSKKRMKENASIKFSTCAIIVIMLSTVFTGCGKEEAVDVAVTAPKAIQASSADGTLVYIPVSAASASSFDQTPDWAPEPNPMAPVDGDMMTRWSSGYEGGEQWISFDLGGYRVVSDIIVRWERAYAVDYDVMVSNDQKTWDLARAEKNSAGGAVESEFSPVKCRYVKISSTKRVNDAWGVSIWEVEIYGPKDKNPGTVKTKEEYLSGGDEEISRKEVEEAIKKISSAVIPMNVRPFQKGVVYTSWMSDELALPASDLTLTYLKEIGIDTIGIMVPAYQETLVSTEIYTNEGPQGDTPTDQALEHAVKTCHELGMRVMIKPHVDPRTDEARIDILPSEAWFDSYERFITRYAKFSQENGVEIFAIGTELEATTFESWTHRWNALIDKVKSVYAGKLTYAANWTEYAEVPFWDRMDFVGIDAYFPLTNDDNASPQDLAAAWGVIADKIEVWLKNKGLTEKGVILTEIGYPSADGANRQPWAAISSQEDQQEQADCLEAVMKILTARSWFKGYYLWQYFPQDRWSPLGFTVKGKKAEEIIKKWLKVS